ncbi:MAG: PleD family two-component system response regulator [Maioricimonas sp. JB049]
MPARILVCDDEPHITRIIEYRLRRAGYEIEAASDGLAGWEALQQNPPSLLITDCQMPRMNGLELCRTIRSDDRFEKLPIILLTAKGYELSSQMLHQELHVAAVMSKPFSPRELTRLVRLFASQGDGEELPSGETNICSPADEPPQ